MKRLYICAALTTAALAGVAGTANATTVYRWTDERGVVNYSNERPKGRAPKDLHAIEDRVSVYTPEKLPERVRYITPTTMMTAPQWPAPSAPAVPLAYDPCASTPGDPNCYPAGVYGARGLGNRAPVLVQPQFPSGAIAGNIVGPGTIPGQSGTTPNTAVRGFRSTEPSASFTLPPKTHGSGSHGSRR